MTERMDTQRWQQVAAIFDEVVELEGDERVARLDALCAGDVELRAEVASLLQGDEAADSAPLLIDSPTRAREAWQKKFGHAPEDAKAHAKQARFMASRGFSNETFRRVLAEHREGGDD